ncbi:hypothetical protein LTR91_004783 [Friedmanniomyces endolithicus]|uniref:Enoyl reductase (ER) domain-containing protein n=2 Tax=Friedmanniomyces endolithicus TaxID=329885 RepID=A0AAN6KUU6_9PEZI|nr:hypothetical protein LTS00_013096 [Friedmanniomyces endolithicus]KAK0280366.1 hypothetical protein LTR35_008007 [Friedmanniomyces endolithicus]KAK0326905.1 hypothetical protein LTR82_001665 [Friedmanniomyces endolithicus]KAK0828910.1 hypothetical protein LTR73_004542 [Friedmanniomyces endolithicus]KAK0929904.1 hypothetical protein LTR57_001762 [Friedmanniomyces endolithicus]
MAETTLPKEMKAQVLEAFNQPYALKTLPIPQLASNDDLLIKVDAASYCHTDAVLASGQMRPNPPSFPHISCHEFAGTVVSLSDSPSTAAKQYRVGQQVGVPGRAYHPCGTCFECQDTSRQDSDSVGYSVYCSNARNNGISRNGGFAEYAVVDARQVALLPESITPVDAAPLMCAGVTIFGALKRCNLSRGQRVGIIGAGGGLGHLGLQFATAMGLKTLGVDAADGPLQLAKSLRTKAEILDARTQNAEAVVQRLGAEDGETNAANMGLDAVIVLPEAQAGFDFGMALLKHHGVCVVVSFPEAGFHVSARDLVFRDIRIIGSLVGGNNTLQEMLEFAAKHEVKAVSKTFALAELNGLVEEYHKAAGGKLVVDMSL